MIAAVVALTLILLYVLYDRSKERKEWTQERRLLLTRIQAPETISPEVPDGPMPMAVLPDSDEDFWAAQAMRTDNGAS